MRSRVSAWKDNKGHNEIVADVLTWEYACLINEEGQYSSVVGHMQTGDKKGKRY